MIARDFFSHRYESERNASIVPHSDNEGRIHVAVYSAEFTNFGISPLWTTTMYSNLKEDILSSVELLPVKEKPILDIYESGSATEFDHERILIGFKKYLSLCYLSSRRHLLAHLVTFALFLIIGILIVFALYTNRLTFLPDWISALVDAVAAVFIWQFVGYMAYDFVPERKSTRRLAQIQSLEYRFHHWE